MFMMFLWRTYIIENVRDVHLKKKRNAPRGNALHVFKNVAAGQEWKKIKREKKTKIHIVSLTTVLDFSSRPFPASISFWKKSKYTSR